MSELSNEDKQRKQNLLDELKVVRKKQEETLERRNALMDELNPSAKIEGEIINVKTGIRKDQDKIKMLETNLNISNRNMDKSIEFKEMMATSAEGEAQELKSQLEKARERQRLEQLELQSLESKQNLPTEQPKGFFATMVSSVKRFINRKSIAMEKRQAEIDINSSKRRVNQATNEVSKIEEKLKLKESIAQVAKSDCEKQKSEAEKKRLEQEEKVSTEISQIKEDISKKEEEKTRLEAQKEETLKKILARPKEETEKIKNKLDKANKDLEAVNAEVRDIQAKITEIDPNRYLTKELVDNLFSGILGYPPKSAKAQENEALQEHKTISPDSEEKRDANNGAKEPTQRESFRARLRDFTPVKQETRQQTEKQFERNIEDGEEWSMG